MNSFYKSPTQVIDSDMHLEPVDSFCVGAHHHPGVVYKDMELVDF